MPSKPLPKYLRPNPASKPLQFATTELISVPEYNVLNAALALVRVKRAQLGDFFVPFVIELQKSDPDLARLLRSADLLNAMRADDKKRREQHYRQTRRPQGPAGTKAGHTFVDMSDPPGRGGTVTITGVERHRLR